MKLGLRTFSSATSRCCAALGPILDVGSGRGELLDLLAVAGEPARGVDSDEGMVALSRAKGHDVTLGDAVNHLGTLETASLGAIFCAQLVEHLTYPELRAFLVESARVLRPGGILIAETVNPEPVQSFKAFWIDPTHETSAVSRSPADALPAGRLRSRPGPLSGRDRRSEQGSSHPAGLFSACRDAVLTNSRIVRHRCRPPPSLRGSLADEFKAGNEQHSDGNQPDERHQNRAG